MCQTAAHFLKSHTATQHQALEDVVLARLHALHTVADYAHLLQQFYGYYHPLEERIAQRLDDRDLPDLAKRRNARLILEDVTFSNAHTSLLPLATELPLLATKAAAWGALYVLEGSTLGGRYITKLLLKNDALNLTEKQVRFFNGYGAETGAMWRRFVECLDEQGTAARAQNEMAAAANETFSLFKIWLLEYDNQTEP